MTFSKNQKITIILALFAGFIAIWAATYIHSADIVFVKFDPPNIINSDNGNQLRFELINYGNKKGSFILSLSSEEILFSSEKSYNPDDYNETISVSSVLGPNKENLVNNFYLITNESNLKQDGHITFTYMDASPLIVKKMYIWDFDYELNNQNNYIFKNKDFELKKVIIFKGIMMNINI